ncbi:class I SAM-dependent methyltransferase [Halobacteriovorax sp. ZH5_bin.2]|uniref:class I SAM-dependent methyltransferase n=1 Tax=Halobacteriovorax sp. ZH5_bin.2 TaxID=3157727 RepID=UPI0037122434
MSSCLICNNQEWDKYYSYSDYDFLICKKCGLGKLSPQPTKEYLDKYYARVYRKNNKNEHVEDFALNYEQKRADIIIPFIKNNSNNLEVTMALDVGCSTGTLLYNIKSRLNATDCVGIELNENYFSYAKQRSDLNLNSELSQNCALEDADLPMGSFDVVTLVHVLEHMPKPEESLEIIYDLLSDEGVFYLEVPDLYTPYSNLKNKYIAPYHLFYFNNSNLSFYLEKLGFSIIEKSKVSNTSCRFLLKKAKENNKKLELSENYYNDVIHSLKKYRFIKYPYIFFKQQVKRLVRK